uniref:6-pyruvoyltetrahydropterin synthase n=1 Tax=Anser cygnoides TaxID=8845 RepID=A0A8B9E886_ANSCY
MDSLEKGKTKGATPKSGLWGHILQHPLALSRSAHSPPAARAGLFPRGPLGLGSAAPEAGRSCSRSGGTAAASPRPRAGIARRPPSTPGTGTRGARPCPAPGGCGSLSDEENLKLFGKCNNPNGHGHNYKGKELASTPACGHGERPA